MKYIIQPGIQIGNTKNVESIKNTGSAENAVNTENAGNTENAKNVGNTESKIINALTTKEVEEYRKNGFKCKAREYQLTTEHGKNDVVCMEIWKKGDKEHSLIIPSFLIPKRNYPIYVYIFAINLYSSNPKLGQRKVAKETRKEFNLKTFAHTTVGRAMKTLAETLTKTAVENNETVEEKRLTEQNKANTGTIHKKRFPSVQDTNTRREMVKSFFYDRLKNRCQQEFKDACDGIAIYWYNHFDRLLMNTAPGIRCRLSSAVQNT
jgi:hypothetical protein